MHIQRFVVSSLLAAAVSGCTGGMTAAYQSLREVLPQLARTDAALLDPRFEYLRITRNKRLALAWRGAVEQSDAGRVDVYYSSAGEVLRLLNGRIVGAVGLSTEWRRVTIKASDWAAAAAAPGGTRVIRTRDVMPGYISDLREELALHRIAAPSGSALRVVDPASLAWFEERVVASAAQPPLPPARYAVDLAAGGGTVVYAEQCLAPNLCISWQRWSAALQSAAR